MNRLSSVKTYLPRLVESTDSSCVKTHDDGKCRVQISLGFTAVCNTGRSRKMLLKKEIKHDVLKTYSSFCLHDHVCVLFLLSCNLDKLLEKLYSLVERYTHEHLGHDPLLDLVTALQQDWERRRVASARSAAQSVVHQLLLHVDGKKECEWNTSRNTHPWVCSPSINEATSPLLVSL